MVPLSHTLSLEVQSFKFTVFNKIQSNPALRPPLYIIRSPRYYGHFLSAWQNGHTFTYKKSPLMRSPVNTANGLILKSETV